MDPPHTGPNPIPGDVLWSDPSNVLGLTHNTARGIGLLFGPDCTQEFMEQNHLKVLQSVALTKLQSILEVHVCNFLVSHSFCMQLIVRSHEGPDARDRRSDMADMSKGYTIDHQVDAGKLVTLFSAPDYPQFQEWLKYSCLEMELTPT
eukprot:TRINITY_DN2135_c0_g1_i1.p1 TRINITY_DN2135_c0_g1~~TRINITY_DN2135_c0_g1_i1.p1  ORF type:complete len:163 (-),score=17.43 TRINITY_DN2135_c0_g1_i1:257-700(-)